MVPMAVYTEETCQVGLECAVFQGLECGLHLSDLSDMQDFLWKSLRIRSRAFYSHVSVFSMRVGTCWKWQMSMWGDEPFKWLVKLDKSDEPASVLMAISYVQKLAGLHQVIDEKEEWPRPYAPTSLKKDVLHEILEFTASKRKTLQGIMWEFVGLVRSTECLEIAQRKLCELKLDWEEELFRKGWQPNMVHVKV